MMSIRSKVSVPALMIILGATAGSAACAPMVYTTVPIKNIHRLNAEELRAFQQLALAGDLTASNCLTNHYALGASEDDPDAHYWILIGAENGDADSMMVISLVFEKSKVQRER